MANSWAPNGQLAVHLTDQALTPIVSSANLPSPSHTNRSAEPQLEALTSLSSTAIAAFEAASRLGLGVPQRILVETSSGPVILHSFLTPVSPRLSSPHDGHQTNEQGIVEQAYEDLRPLSATTEGESTLDVREDRSTLVNGVSNGSDEDEYADVVANQDSVGSTSQLPPILVASVIAQSHGELRNARRAAARLERTGREIQRDWTKDQDTGPEDDPTEDG